MRGGIGDEEGGIGKRREKFPGDEVGGTQGSCGIAAASPSSGPQETPTTAGGGGPQYSYHSYPGGGAPPPSARTRGRISSELFSRSLGE